MNKTETAIN